MKDALGRPRTPANTPGSRKGLAPPNAGRKFPAEPLDHDEMSRLLDAALHPGTPDPRSSAPWATTSAPRNHALLTVLWRTGLRLGEALALMPRDVDLTKRTISVEKSKTAAGVRTVGLDDIAAESLERWLEVRAGLGVNGSCPVFCTVLHGAGRPIAPSTWQGTIKAIARRAGIVKHRVHSHGLRHTFAAEVVSEGESLPVISKMLGHKNAAITLHYVDNTLSRSKAVEAMQRRGTVVAGRSI